MHASTQVLDNESQTLPETIGDVVRRAMAHTTFEDICFVHFPREEVPVRLLQAQDIEPASDSRLRGSNLHFDKADLAVHTRRMRGIARSVAAVSCLESKHGAFVAEGHLLHRSPERSLPHEAGQCD